MINNPYIFSIISRISTILTGLFTTMAMSRYLGPTLKGELAYITNVVGILAIVMGMGIEQSYGYFIRKNEIDITSKFIKYTSIINIAYCLFAIIINMGVKSELILYISILTILNIIVSQLTYITLIRDIIKRNKIMLISNTTYCLIVGILFFVAERNINYAITALYIKLMIEIILYSLSIRNEFKFNVKLERKYVSKVMKIGIPGMIMSLLVTFNYSLDIIILKEYVDFFRVGLYSSGVAIANLAWIFSDAFKEVLFSKTSKENNINEIVFGIKVNIVICIIMLIGFIVFGKIIILIIHGKEYIESYTVTTILLIGTIPMMFFKLINTLYVNLGKQMKSMIILLFSVLINLVMNTILIPKYDINGAAISSVISYFVCGIFFIVSFSKQFNISMKEYLVWDKSEIDKLKILR